MSARTLLTLLISTSAFVLASPATLPATAAAKVAPQGGRAAISAPPAAPTPAESASGSAWHPRSLRGCALAFGAALGALASMGQNPMLGSIVASLALHAALYACF